jgi:hypothetical protein
MIARTSVSATLAVVVCLLGSFTPAVAYGQTEQAPARKDRGPCAVDGPNPGLDDARATSDRVGTLVVPVEGCRLPLKTPDDSSTLPSPTSGYGWRLLEQSFDPVALVRIELSRRSAAPAGAPAVEKFFESSDVARADQQLLVPGGFDGWLDVVRLDLKEMPVRIKVTLSREELTSDPKRPNEVRFLGESASTGQAFRTDITFDEQQLLIGLARNYRSREKAAPATKAAAYRMISTLTGRRIEQVEMGKPTESEPMVVFLGLSGLNRLVLIDCVSRVMPATREKRSDIKCERLSEPWQTTFERASHFWAVYIEDEQAGFETSIDVEFPNEQRSADYDDFDPLNSVRDTVPITGSDRRVRVGFRRFTIPARQDLVRITFSRQGAVYGLRSWSREYKRYGRLPVQVAGGVAVPAWFLTRSQLALDNVYGTDPLNPVALQLSEERTRQPIFAMGFLRFATLHAAAEQATGIRRMLVPDLAAGVGLPWIDGENLWGQTLAFGGSWRVGFGSRVHFLAGVQKIHTIKGGPVIGSRFPIGTTLDQVRGVDRKWLPMLGLSVDIARTP